MSHNPVSDDKAAAQAAAAPDYNRHILTFHAAGVVGEGMDVSTEMAAPVADNPTVAGPGAG